MRGDEIEQAAEELPVVGAHDGVVEHQADGVAGGRRYRVGDRAAPRCGPDGGAAAAGPVEMHRQLAQLRVVERRRGAIPRQHVETELDECLGRRRRAAIPWRREQPALETAYSIGEAAPAFGDVVALLREGARAAELAFASRRLVIGVAVAMLVDRDAAARS